MSSDLATDTNKIFPFANGTQYLDWDHVNCFHCKKATINSSKILDCQIEQSLVNACFEDGSVTEDIANRMGYKDETPPLHIWQCGEFEGVPQ